jgi:uncharacterized protein YqeY
MPAEATMLTDVIRERMLEAMKAGKDVEKSVLRVALGEIQSSESRTGETLDDEGVAAVLRKLVKSNTDTIAAGADAERRAVLEAENEILESLLPKTLSVEEIAAALGDVLDAIRGAGNDGQATGIAMKHLKAAGAPVNGKDVAQAVRGLRQA